jgi:hypothetical protein
LQLHSRSDESEQPSKFIEFPFHQMSVVAVHGLGKKKWYQLQ